jgi:hypothetical protein
MNDLRYAIRMLVKNRGLAAAAIVSLGLGIGANAVIFSWLKAVLLYPLPGVARQGDLVAIATRTRDGGYVNLSYPDYRDYRDSTRTLDGLVVTETTKLSPRTFWISRASSRHSGGKGRLRESGADPGHSSARLLGRPRDPLVPGSRLQTHGPAGPGDQLSVIMRPRRLMGTSRRPPIGWLQRGPGVPRPRVPSGLLEPRPLCRSTSRPASVRETPNVAAPGCVRGHRTRPIAGPW